MNELIRSFNYEPNEVRITMQDDEPRFCLKDVCDILDIKNPSDLIAKSLDSEGIDKIYTPTSSGVQEMWFINEPNLYRVIFRSNKKEAKKFQDWVFNEVLPSIRKNGIYLPSIQTETPELLVKINELEARIETFVTLTSHESRLLQKAISRRVYEMELPPSQRPQAFAELHREIRDRFGVPSYRDVARTEFQSALNYIRGWVPRKVSA
jgi:prophage antirepressor-like protein